MINLLISIVIGVVVFLATGYGLGGGNLNAWYGIIPGLLALVIAYIFLARRTFKQVEAISLHAQAVLEQRDLKQGIEILETARPLGKWQFLVESQIDSQIGSIYFIIKDFKAAEPYLRKGFSKNWTAQAQLGVLYFKHREYAKMVEAFENGVKANKTQPLLWNVYAYCQSDRGETDEAISILNRALKHVDEDEKTKNNLRLLQNKKKMKMRGWDMMWYQFHLDRPPQPSMDQFQQPFRRNRR